MSKELFKIEEIFVEREFSTEHLDDLDNPDGLFKVEEVFAGFLVTQPEFFFRTTAQDSISPSIATLDASLADWHWGDGEKTLEDNAPTYVYTDGAASHDVDIKIDDPLQVDRIVLVNSGITDLDITPYLNVKTLLLDRNPGLTELDLLAFTELDNLAVFNTSVGPELILTGLNKIRRFRAWESGLTTIGSLTSPVLEELIIRENPIPRLDVSRYPELTRLECWNCIIETDLDTSNSPELSILWAYDNPLIGDIDISDNPLMIDFLIQNTGRTAGEIDRYLADLDGHGLFNGVFNYSLNPGESDVTNYVAYDNLIAKGWTIIGNAPVSPSTRLFTTTSQGTITPHIFFTDSSLATWYFGDGAIAEDINNPSHTYTDGLPSHEVGLGSNVDFSKVRQLQFGGDSITDLDLPLIPNVTKLYIGQNPSLNIPLGGFPNGPNLQILNIQGNNQVSAMDLTNFSSLVTLILNGNSSLSDVTWPVSSPSMYRLYLNNTSLSDVDISGLPNLNDVPMQSAQFPSEVIDDVLIRLDGFGRNNGYLNYNNNPGTATSAAYNAYQNLVAKGWTIVGTPPPPPLLALFRTESQGTITPEIEPFAGVASWDWGDGNTTLNDNSPTHTYTDGAPFHDVGTFGIDPLDIRRFISPADEITSIDTSELLNVEFLFINNNGITALDLSANTKIIGLRAFINDLNTLILPNTSTLTDLDIPNNPNLGNQDYSNLPGLESLRINNTGLTSLDITSNPLIDDLRVSNNSLVELSISSNPLIRTLRCDNNDLTADELDDIITTLDSNGVLNGVLVYSSNAEDPTSSSYNAYQNLISKGWTITGTPPPAPPSPTSLFTTMALTISPIIATADASLADWSWGDGNATLANNAPSHTYTDGQPSHDVNITIADPLQVTQLDINSDDVTAVDPTPYVNLTRLRVERNLLTSIDVLNLIEMDDLRVWNNNISVLQIENMTKMTRLDCRSNPIQVLALDNLVALELLTAFNCALNTALNTSNSPNLRTMRIFNNPDLGALDISNNTFLNNLDVRTTGRTATEIDQYIITLDNHGQINGDLRYSSNPGSPTSASYNAYQNLISKGWTITGDVPPSPLAFPYTLPITFTA